MNVLGVAELFVCGFGGPKFGARLSRGETAANSISVLLDCQCEKRQCPIWKSISGPLEMAVVDNRQSLSLRCLFAFLRVNAL